MNHIVIVDSEMDAGRRCLVMRLRGVKILRVIIVGAALLAASVLTFLWLITLHNAAGVKNRHEAEIALDSTLDLTAVNGIRTGGASARRLLSAVPDLKKEALNGLEGAVLEPPTKRKERLRPKYLPDLMGDSLAGYPRRVFVDVGPAGRAGSEGWFGRHYPKRDLDFDIIRVDYEVGSNGGNEEAMTEWLKRSVKEEEYVVMKAEAEVVLEMVKAKAIGLVDELFLECRNQWHKEKKKSSVGGGEALKSKRAYWECLAIYGRLKDEGIAVHQWWD